MQFDLSQDYDLASIIQLKTKYYDFELFCTPRFSSQYFSQTYEEMTAIIIRQMVKGVSTFIDVGAHYGFYDVLVGKSNPQCEIFSYEPVEENVEVIQENLNFHGISAHIFQKAVSSTNGIEQFEVSEACDSSGFVADPDFDILKIINVETVNIDSLINQIGKGPILIKIDVVGSEIAVLEGMKNTIEAFNDIRLFISLNSKCLQANGFNPLELFTILKSFGFQIHLINDENGVFYKVNEMKDLENFLTGNKNYNLYCKKEKNALNLCFFSHSSQLAGAERRLINLANELISDYGTLCTVIMPNKGPLNEKLHKVGCATVGISYHWWCVDNRKHLPNLPRNLKESYFAIKLSKIINDLHPDIIITNTMVIPWGAVFAYENGIPHLWMVNEFGRADHGFIFNFGLDQILQFIEAQSDKIITCSKSVKNELFNSSDQVDVIYDSFSNLSKYISNIKPADDVFLNDEAFHLLLTGTISIGKGQLDAVRAAIELIKNRGEKIELVLIGYPNNNYQNELITLINNENVENDIRILPFRDDIYPVMKSTDVILICSKFEAFGRVIVEGMLLNKPVIGTNTGGIVESIQHGKTGLLYSPGNYLELANQIQMIMENHDLQNSIATNGRSFAVGKFSKQNFSGRFYSEFLELKRVRNELSKKSCNEMIYLYQAILDGCIFDIEDPERTNIFANRLRRKDQEIRNLESQLLEKEQKIFSYSLSKSWRFTRPFRKLRIFRKGQ